MAGTEKSNLCHTFTDIVKITSDLGFLHLWIDVLYIVQGDAEDWGRESIQMPEIYTNSTLTIAATSAVDGNGGCPSMLNIGYPSTISERLRRVPHTDEVRSEGYPSYSEYPAKAARDAVRDIKPIRGLQIWKP